jgi:fructosamine-3-kinase
MFEADDFDGFFRTAIGRHTGYWPDKIECSAAGSSTFSQTARVKTENGLDVFIKCSEHVPEDAYAAEAEGLQMLASHTDMHIPEVVGTGTIEGKNYIILQFVGTTQAGALYWLHFGRGLATLHACTATRFGYHKSNYLGLLPQRNAWNTSFDVFFV